MSLLTRKGKEIRKTQIFFAWSSFILGEVLQFWAYAKTGRILVIEDLYGGWWFGLVLTALLGFFAVPVVLGLTGVFEEDNPVMARVIFYIFNFGIFFAPYVTIVATLVLFWGFIIYTDQEELKKLKNGKDDLEGGWICAYIAAIVLGNIFMHIYYARTKTEPIVTPFLQACGLDVKLTGWLWISTGCAVILFFSSLEGGKPSWYHFLSVLIILFLPGIGQVLLVLTNIIISKRRFYRKGVAGPRMIFVCSIMAAMWIFGMVHLVQTQGWQALPLVEYLLEFIQAM